MSQKSLWDRIVQWTIAAGERILVPVERFIGRRSLVGEATFFENGRFPWIAELETNWTTIREELEHVLEDREALPDFLIGNDGDEAAGEEISGENDGAYAPDAMAAE